MVTSSLGGVPFGQKFGIEQIGILVDVKGQGRSYEASEDKQSDLKLIIHSCKPTLSLKQDVEVCPFQPVLILT